MVEIQFFMYDADEKIEVVVKDEMIWATDILKDYIKNR